ncbi:MAG: sugar O-acetyltransferase, partial [Selenomonadaceae bacterium]|nr:sugar O-acetyltransferase [Selenomonadaceae bacterium]
NSPKRASERQQLMKEMLGSVGSNCYMESPFHANWGGRNLFLGNNVYINFNLTVVDDVEIIVGDYVMFGPNVTIATANHPIDPALRQKGYQYAKKITIGNNVWIGANAVILPGVTIGENSIIGAGSIVTKDIPPNVVAVGNPCRVMRSIKESDDRVNFN